VRWLPQLNRLNAIHPAAIATRSGVVEMKVGNAVIAEQPLDLSFQRITLRDGRVQHHAGSVIRAHRQETPPHRLRNLVDAGNGLPGSLAYEDGARSPVGRSDGMMSKW